MESTQIMRSATITKFDRSRNASNFSTDQIFRKIIAGFSHYRLDQFDLEASVSGIDFNRNMIAILIKIENFAQLLENDTSLSFERSDVIHRWKKKIENVINSYFTRGSVVMTAYLGGDKFLAVLPTEGREENLKSHLKKSFQAIFGQLLYGPIENITVGFGDIHHGTLGVIESSREADLALKLGLKLGGAKRSYSFEEFGILYTFAEGDLDKKVSIAQKTLASIEKSKKLYQTLMSFFKNNLSISETADELGVHRNTIAYRIKQIAQRIGLDPQIFDQAVVIKTALLIKKLA